MASGRRNQNSIWSLEDSEGNCVEDESALKDLGKAQFSSIFKDDGGTCLAHQLKVVLLFHRMIPIEHSSLLSCPVNLGPRWMACGILPELL